MSNPTRHHLNKIDALRAAAILLVFNNHIYPIFWGHSEWSWHGNWFHWQDEPSAFVILLRTTILGGRWGVCLFFVISGLCIRLSHLRKGGFLAGSFFWHRFWRIYPPYLVALGLFVFAMQLNGDRLTRADLISHLLLVHNFSEHFIYSINPPFWSLALEAQVYLLYPVLLILNRKLGTVFVFWLLAVVAIATQVVGGHAFIQFFRLPSSFQVVGEMPTLLWFAWFTGFVCADRFVSGEPAPSKAYWIYIVSGLAATVLAALFRPLTPLHGPLMAITLMCVVEKFIRQPYNRVTDRGIIPLIGVVSYSMYLYFDKLIVLVAPVLKRVLPLGTGMLSFGLAYLVTLAIVVLSAFAMYKIIEVPSLKIVRLSREHRLRATGGKA